MACSVCHNIVDNVGERATSVKCNECVENEISNAINKQEEELKGGLNEMVEQKKSKLPKDAPAQKSSSDDKQTRKDKYKELEPKVISMAKAGKTPAEISKELGGHPAVPKIKRILAAAN